MIPSNINLSGAEIDLMSEDRKNLDSKKHLLRFALDLIYYN